MKGRKNYQQGKTQTVKVRIKTRKVKKMKKGDEKQAQSRGKNARLATLTRSRSTFKTALTESEETHLKGESI
jgi:ASC-1-like (ASCH) protein